MCLVSIITYGQINIGPVELVRLKPGTFTNTQIKELQATKTLFVHRKADLPYLDELKKVLSEVWDVTEISVISPGELGEYLKKPGYSYFTLGGVTTETTNTGSGFSYDNSHFWLTLWIPGKKKKQTYCSIELHPTYESYKNAESEETKDILTFMYTAAKYHNWNLGFLKNYLQLVNEGVKSGRERWLYEKDKDKDKVALSKLVSQPLYIPSYALRSSICGQEMNLRPRMRKSL